MFMSLVGGRFFFNITLAGLEMMVLVASSTPLFFFCNAYSPWTQASEFTPPKFNIAPEKWWLEDEFPFGIAYV